MTGDSPSGLTHIDSRGNARMVDVSTKPATPRRATAQGSVRMRPATLELITGGGLGKGDVLGVARVAAIMAAKRTGDLIPLCHPLGLDSVTVDFTPAPPDRILISATAGLIGRTGVEMEALTAVSIAALTIYDMCKAADKEMVVGETWLAAKTGGRSGDFRHPSPPA